MVTVCADTPDEVRKGKSKHNLDALMLSDNDLAAADSLGIRNIGKTSAPRPVPVPTTVLVDQDGIVRWLDQSEHYTQRSDREIVRNALKSHLSID